MRKGCLLLFRLLLAFLVLAPCHAWADFSTAQIQVDEGGSWQTLAVGAQAFGPTTRYSWQTVPQSLSDDGFSFYQVNPGPGWPVVGDGIITFEITQSGPAYMAVTTRFGDGGNDSGGWVPQLTTEQQLIDQGWQEVGSGLSDVDNLSGITDVNMLIFERNSVAGDTFTYRTEKYIPPIPLEVLPSPPPPPQPTNFVIDSNQSSLTASITIGSLPVTPQAPGSLTTSLTGHIVADLSAPGTISFPGGSNIVPANQPGTFQPGGTPAQIAGQVLLFGSPLVTGAIRNLVADLTGASQPLDANSHFSSSLLSLAMQGGTLDWQSPSLGSGSDSLDFTYSNMSTAQGTVINLGNGHTELIIPFDFMFAGQIATNPVTFDLSGQVVAFSAVPEPATWLLAAIGGVAIIGLARRRFVHR